MLISQFIVYFVLLLICRVCDDIKYGWDIYVINRDGGSNIKKKLLEIPSSTETVLLQSIPKANDSHWSKEMYKIPKITFSTIYQFLVERKALVQKADHVDNIIERRNSSSLYCNGDNPLDPNVGDPIAYTRTLDKAYRFLWMDMSRKLGIILCQLSLMLFV